MTHLQKNIIQGVVGSIAAIFMLRRTFATEGATLATLGKISLTLAIMAAAVWILRKRYGQKNPDPPPELPFVERYAGGLVAAVIVPAFCIIYFASQP